MPYADLEARKAAQRARWHNRNKFLPRYSKSGAADRFPTPEELARRVLDWKAIGQAYRGIHD